MTKSFDVFLSHNSKDKPAVRELAEALRARGLKVWLDEWELIPGRPWQEALEEIIETTRCSAVLVGKDGLGPWQDAEMRGCLSEFVDRKQPVIPVLLPGAPEVPRLPFFLKRFTWVDLRGGLTEAGIDRLQWGVTGKRPVVLLGSSWVQATEHGTPPLIALGGSSASLPPTPPTRRQTATVSTHMARTPSRQGPLMVPRRTILAASIGALLLLAVAAALFGWLWWTTPRVGRDAQEDARQKQVVGLVHTASLSLRVGDPTRLAQENRQRPSRPTAQEKIAANTSVLATANLHISFQSVQPAAVFVFFNGRKVLQKTVGGGGCLYTEGLAGWTVEIEPGVAEIKVYVAPSGKAAMVHSRTGSFPSGSRRSLDIRLSADGQSSVALN